MSAPAAAPDGGADLRAAARVIALVFFANGALLGAWGSRIPAIREDLDLSEGQLGIALAALAVGALIAMPLAGAWAARDGSRRPTRTLLAFFCVAPFLAASAPSLAVLMLGGLILGISNGGLDVSMNTQATTIEQRRGTLLLGRVHAGFSAGGMVGAATGALAAHADLAPEIHLGVLGLVLAAIALPASRVLVADDAHPRAADGSGPKFVRPSGVLLVLGVVAFCSYLSEGAALDWSAVYVEDSLSGSSSVAALAYASFSALMLLGRLASDKLVATFGPTTLMRGGGTLAGAGLAVAVLIGEPWAALIGFATLGAGLSVIVPLVFRAAAGAGGGPTLAVATTMGYAGLLAGPPIIGAIAEVASLPVGMAFVACLAFTTALLSPIIRRIGSGAPTPLPDPA